MDAESRAHRRFAARRGQGSGSPGTDRPGLCPSGRGGKATHLSARSMVGTGVLPETSRVPNPEREMGQEVGIAHGEATRGSGECGDSPKRGGAPHTRGGLPPGEPRFTVRHPRYGGWRQFSPPRRPLSTFASSAEAAASEIDRNGQRGGVAEMPAVERLLRRLVRQECVEHLRQTIFSRAIGQIYVDFLAGTRLGQPCERVAVRKSTY